MIYNDILNAPHTLIGGTTGSGKSVLMNGVITSFIENVPIDKAYMILIDPKKVEFSIYADCENCAAYADELPAIIAVLDSAIEVIGERYDWMKQNHMRKFPGREVYIFIDELADLMISAKAKDIKVKLQKILQIGRAAGVHIIAATQAPNRKVIPAELVLNFTDRIALRCLSAIESRQLINAPGAESLPRYGKAIYMSPAGYQTVDIPFISDAIAESVAARHSKPRRTESVFGNVIRGLFKNSRFARA